MMEGNYSFGIERDVEKLKANNVDPTKWSNPLEVQSVIGRQRLGWMYADTFVGSPTRPR